VIYEEIPRALAYRLPHRNPLILQILCNRGLCTPEEIEAFLEGSVRFYDPLAMRDLPAAVERLLRAVQRGERVVVYGDFDADGVTSTVLMVQTLRALGAQATPYIPNRVDEGYGLNIPAIERIADDGATLLLTVDCGIRSPDEVARATALGMDVIVTDHHTIRRNADGVDELPPALAVVNPKRQDDPYPFEDLAGVGVAFKLAQALLAAHPDGAPVADADLLDLVALGTVADVMPLPLLEENRQLVQSGLLELNHPRRPGIQAMLDEARLSPGRVTATDIGFILGPRLNAAGRLESAMLAYDLLMAPDALTARGLAQALSELNRRRQAKTQELVLLARGHIDGAAATPELFLLDDEKFEAGIVGLVAGRLVEEYYRPVLLVHRDAEFSRGSARSIPEFNVTAALDECRDLLVRHGGHAIAAGFTVRTEDLPELRARLEAIASRELAGKDLAPTLQIDARVQLEEMDWAMLDMLRVLEPHGHGNPQPVFAATGLEVANERPVGSDGRHLKLTLRDPYASGPISRRVWDAIGFNLGWWSGNLPRWVDVAFTFESNEYNGDTRLQLNLKDLRPAADPPSY
jgi:single-stranded-DNA-specific exonuclease